MFSVWYTIPIGKRSHQPKYKLNSTTTQQNSILTVCYYRSGRDRKPIEVIGTYNPIPAPLPEELKAKGERPIKDVALDFQRAKYWLGVGAQPTEPLTKLFKKAGILNVEWPAPSRVLKPINDKVVAPQKNIVD